MLNSAFGHLVRESLYLCKLFSEFLTLAHTIRQDNAIAHALPKIARLYFPLYTWMKFVPLDVEFVISTNLAVPKIILCHFPSKKKL